MSTPNLGVIVKRKGKKTRKRCRGRRSPEHSGTVGMLGRRRKDRSSHEMKLQDRPRKNYTSFDMSISFVISRTNEKPIKCFELGKDG